MTGLFFYFYQELGVGYIILCFVVVVVGTVCGREGAGGVITVL